MYDLLSIVIVLSCTVTVVPGHHEVEGNEIVHVLAKQAARLHFVGPEPATRWYLLYLCTATWDSGWVRNCSNAGK